MEFPEEPYRTESLGHLGLVAATINELGLVEKINKRLPLDYKKGGKISHGHRSAAMLLNGLGYVTRTLYLSPHFFANKPLDLLLGIDATYEDFNDDMLGRHLDEIAKYGPTELFSEVMYEVCTEQGLWQGNYNLDSTSLSLFGDYADYPDASPLPTLGYSKDNRPDLKQITVTLTQVSEANIPIWYEALDGNSSDKKSFQETLKLIKQFQSSLKDMPDNIPFIVDAAFYTPTSLKELNNVTWLTRVPANYKEAKHWLTQPDDSLNWDEVDSHNKIYSFELTHEDIEQRWTLVDSAKGREKSKKTFFKKLDKTYKEQSNALWHLCNQCFSCHEDADTAMKKFSKQLKYHQLHYKVVPIMKHQGRGRPKCDASQGCVGYSCQATLSSSLSVINKEIERLGRFILATNELNAEILPSYEMLTQYKSQTHVERGFRFLKADEFELDHIFLKDPNRIGALMMLMTLCLVVYNFAQYSLRKTLEREDVVVPNQQGKPIKNPTLRWIYQLMSSISVLCLWDDNNQCWVKRVCNLKKIHKIILYHYSPQALTIYGLPAAMPLPEYDMKQKPLVEWCKM